MNCMRGFALNHLKVGRQGNPAGNPRGRSLRGLVRCVRFVESKMHDRTALVQIIIVRAFSAHHPEGNFF